MPLGTRCLAWLLLTGVSVSALGLRRFMEAPMSELPVHGTVVADGTPVADAVVRLAGRPHAVLSNEGGAFTLPYPATRDGARVVASKAGFFIAGASVDRGLGQLSIDLRRHPIDDNPEYAWVDPRPDPSNAGRCGNCHREIFDEWSASSHAASATNRRLLNVYDGTDWKGNQHVGWDLLHDLPDGAGVCHACHLPSQPPPIEVATDLRLEAGVDRRGIHCDFCHKIADVSIDNVGLDHGRFAMAFVRPRGEQQIFFGPLDDVDRGDDVFLPLYKESRYCASCHEGTVFGTHVYGTFSEWLESPQAKQGLQCQDCHMAPTGRMANFAPNQGGIERGPATLASHHFPGSDAGFLREHLSLSLATRETAMGLDVEALVRVQGVGHRVPTGSPSRQLVLHVEAMTEDGSPLTLIEGAVLPALAGVDTHLFQGDPATSELPAFVVRRAIASGNLAGRPGKLFAKVLEGDDGEQGVPFWRNNLVAYDTRLDPDEVSSTRFVFKPSQGASRISARLLYRRFSKRVADEKSWPDNELLIDSRTCEVGPFGSSPVWDLERVRSTLREMNLDW